VSVKIDEDFGSARPGHVYVEAAGDEGALPNHSRAGYSDGAPAILLLQKAGNKRCALSVTVQPCTPAEKLEEGPGRLGRLTARAGERKRSVERAP
jgi:hypothetical protein